MPNCGLEYLGVLLLMSGKLMFSMFSMFDMFGGMFEADLSR